MDYLSNSLPFRKGRMIFLVTADDDLASRLTRLWPESVAQWRVCPQAREALEVIFSEPPDLLVVDERVADMPAREFISVVKGENVYRQVPVVLCITTERLESLGNLDALEVDDFLTLPCGEVEIRARIRLTLARGSRSLDANPLTKLPGNTSIIQRLQELIETREEFALGYIDLDHFKSFNDKYGFARGDEVLMMTARIISNSVRSQGSQAVFVGHVGGDDFVFIVPPDLAEPICASIIRGFDAIVPRFYDDEDRSRFRIVSVDRQGNIREFPIMAVSIGVTFNQQGRMKHYGQASAVAMALNKLAKRDITSSYVLDRRKCS